MFDFSSLVSNTVQALKVGAKVGAKVCATVGGVGLDFVSIVGSAGKEFINSDDKLDQMRYGATQFGEGFKSVWNFPFTVIKMPFHPESAKILWHTTYYSMVCYALPVLAYQGLLRDSLAAGLAGTVGDSILIVDVLMNVVFLRSAINAYAMNAVTNINSASIQLDEPSEKAEVCDKYCQDDDKTKAKYMGPIYDITKNLNGVITSNLYAMGSGIQFVMKPFGEFANHMANWTSSGLHMISPVGTYFFKPLAWGEGIAEIKMSGQCAHHRAEYFAKNVVFNFGMGAAALLWIKGLTVYGFGSLTGVESIWLEDAVFNLVFPLMVFHLHNQVNSDLIKPTQKDYDFFERLRLSSDEAVQKAGEIIVPKVLRLQDGKLIEQLKEMWRKPNIKRARNFLIFPGLQNLHSIVRTGPINFLIRKNKDNIEFGADGVEFLVNRSTMISVYMWLRQSLPLHKQIFNKITHKPEQTLKFVALVRELLAHALKSNAQAKEIQWENNGDFKVKERTHQGPFRPLPPPTSMDELRRTLGVKANALEAEFAVIGQTDGGQAPPQSAYVRRRRTVREQVLGEGNGAGADDAAHPHEDESGELAAFRRILLATHAAQLEAADRQVDDWLRDSVDLGAPTTDSGPRAPIMFTPPSSHSPTPAPVTAVDSPHEVEAVPPYDFAAIRAALDEAEESLSGEDLPDMIRVVIENYGDDPSRSSDEADESGAEDEVSHARFRASLLGSNRT